MSDLPTLALTLIQPWATLVMHHGKDVENRSWAPGKRLPPGTRLFIHAGLKIDEDAVRWARREVPGFDAAMLDRPLPRGEVLGHVRFVESTYVRTSRWHASTQIGWYVADPVALAKPIPCRGAQGLWRLPAELLEEVRRG